MTHNANQDETRLVNALRRSLPAPPDEAVAASKASLDAWYAGAAPLISWQRWSTPVGPLHLAAGPEGLIRISYQDSTDAFLAELDRRARLAEDPEALAPFRRQLAAYFEGELDRFSLPLDLSRVTDFQKRVLSTIARIPSGAVWTYRQVAEAVGKPKAARAVGQALGGNPLPIILPCHRVIASDGTLGGYTGGLAIKRKLLRLEGAQLL